MAYTVINKSTETIRGTVRELGGGGGSWTSDDLAPGEQGSADHSNYGVAVLMSVAVPQYDDVS